MGVNWCPVVILCCGAVATLSAIALVAIGSTTDHWFVITVNRSSVIEHKQENSTDQIYFTRHRGLFRTCFSESERPPDETPFLFLSPLEEWCYPRDYYMKELVGGLLRPANISDPANIHLQLLRVTPVLLFAYLFSMCLIGILGLCGCWQQSSNKLITASAFQLLAALIGACAMATWHAALFFEMDKVHDAGFWMSLPLWVRENSSTAVSWSYITSWVGICLTLVASLLTSGSAICLRSHKRKWEDNSLRMKLKMSRMFAQHAYFPDSPRDYPTMPANYPTKRVIEAFEYERGSLQNDNSQLPMLNGSDLRGGGSVGLRPGGRPGSDLRGQRSINHSRESSSDLSESYRNPNYRRVVTELQNSRF